MKNFELNTSDFAALLPLGILLSLLQVHAAEKYSATVEDGTPKTLSAHEAADMDEFSVTKTVSSKRILRGSAAKTAAASPDLLELKRQNQTLKQRLQVLEQERTQLREQAASEVTEETPESPVPPVLNESVPTAAQELEVSDLPPAEVKKTAQAAELSPKKFDAVPNARISEIAERLKYANDILKRYGRAYDYRSTTLKELKTVLAMLEKAEERSE